MTTSQAAYHGRKKEPQSRFRSARQRLSSPPAPHPRSATLPIPGQTKNSPSEEAPINTYSPKQQTLPLPTSNGETSPASRQTSAQQQPRQSTNYAKASKSRSYSKEMHEVVRDIQNLYEHTLALSRLTLDSKDRNIWAGAVHQSLLTLSRKLPGPLPAVQQHHWERLQQWARDWQTDTASAKASQSTE